VAASNATARNGDYIYGKKRLREIDRRIRFLTKRLDIAEVVDPATRPAPTRSSSGDGPLRSIGTGASDHDRRHRRGRSGARRVSWICRLHGHC